MKKNIYYIVGAVVLSLTSCIDNNLLPDDKTVEEYFWKTKSDVSLMVAGAYESMASSSVIARCIVWGDFRSDEIMPNSTTNLTDGTALALKEINVGGVQTDNTFSDWASFYKVINNCNVVLKHSTGVTTIDPNYTLDDDNVNRSQMLALRSLCYFYLVRAFRDVPYSAEAFKNSSQNLEIPQVAPDSVLQFCIESLEEASKTPLSADAYRDWRRVGFFNIEGINALMADIYLWRAAMTGKAEYYRKCMEYCDKVIDSKKRLPHVDTYEEEASIYGLSKGERMFEEVFIDGNSDESIFELQMDGRSKSNTSACQYYYSYKKNSTNGYTQASKLFAVVDGSANAISNDVAYYSANDYRFWDNCFNVNQGDITAFNIRKMVGESPTGNTSTSLKTVTGTNRPYDNYGQNWIFYRLPDVMLMKAEAIVELATGDTDSTLYEAFRLVREVSDRSLATLADTLLFKNYNTRENMEKLVLAERQRELCFEGKRWFDLMRYNYRHVEGVDANKTLAQQNAEGMDFVANYSNMLTLVQRKYTEGGSSVIYKVASEPKLYLPILESEMKVNANLRQNPAYSSSDIAEKNY